MPAKTNRADKLQSTVIISNRFNERRAQDAARPANEPSAEPLEAGSMVGRYLTLSRIGVGGMGVVYRAHDTKLNRTVALKVLPPRLCKFPEYLKRFRTEAQAQARLNSPYIITLYELMAHPVGEILVLEYVEGETLDNRLRHYGPLSLPEAVRIFEQTLRGVEHIHQMGVVHRDLKPSNIFITHDGQVKLMDFGIARLMDNHDSSQNDTMVGTLLYISPEQINGRETDCRSDVYTLGISLFEAVTGRLPFERTTDYGLMHAHMLENPPRPRHYKRDLPKELERVILKAIEKEPNSRLQSAAEFHEMLLSQSQRYRVALPATAGRVTALPQFLGERLAARNRVLGGIGFDVFLIVVVGLMALALGLYPAQRPQDEVEPATRVVKKPRPVAAAPAAAPRREAPEKDKAAPARDRYDTLRKAWGD